METRNNVEQAQPKGGMGVLGALSLGVGGIVAGSFFATFGLVAEGARGGASLSLLIGGVIALLTAHSYVRLALFFPRATGTTAFIRLAFGEGVWPASVNLMIVLSYATMIALYAMALASYACSLSPALSGKWERPMASATLFLIAFFAITVPALLEKLEGGLNAGKIILLLIFTLAAFFIGEMDWTRFSPSEWPKFGEIASVGMVVFSSYQGFELIVSVSGTMKNRRRDLPLSIYGSILIAVTIYVLTLIAGIGHLSPAEISANRSFALAAAAGNLLGPTGFMIIVLAAIMASASGINADITGADRLPSILSENRELSRVFERRVRGKPVYSLALLIMLAVLAVNTLSLHMISSLSSAGFLLVYTAVNLANARLRRETGGGFRVSLLAATACVAALCIMLVQLLSDPAVRSSAFAVLGMIALSVGIETAQHIYNRTQADPGESGGPRE